MKKKLISIADYQDKFIGEYKKKYEVTQSAVVKRALDILIDKYNRRMARDEKRIKRI